MTFALIAVCVATALLLVYGLFAWQRIASGARAAGDGASAVVRPSIVPDAPRAFGRAAAWFVLPFRDAEAVVRALALRTPLAANWADGLADVRARGVFVSPPVDGVVFATGGDVARLTAEQIQQQLRTLAGLGGRAAWFLCDPERDRFAWGFCDEAGERLYAYEGEHGVVAWHGDVRDDERALGCFVDDPRDGSDDEVKWWPDRRIVHALAARRGGDPDRLADRGAERSVGWIGRLPT